MAQYEVSTRDTMPRKPSRSKDSGRRCFVFGQAQGIFNPETHVVCSWNKLLNELHLTEEAALLAVATNDDLGAKLRTFAARAPRTLCSRRRVNADEAGSGIWRRVPGHSEFAQMGCRRGVTWGA
jgi:hypothetical protein